MKAYKYMFAAMLAAASLSSCSDEKDTSVGEGTVMISATISSDVTVSRTSSDDLAAELNDSFSFWLTSESAGGVIRLYEGLDNLPSSLSLSAGHYVAEAWAGDSISASFDTRYFKSYVPFDVAAGQNTQVDMTLKIANVVVAVEYGDGVLDNYTVDSLFVSHKRGSLTFKPGETTDRGYFMMPSYDQNLNWICICHRNSDNALREFAGTLQNVQAAHLYKFSITYTPADDPNESEGSMYFDLDVDTTEELVYDSVEFFGAPVIQGVYNGEAFDLSNTFTCTEDPGAMGVYVSASSNLDNVFIAGDFLNEIVGLATTSVDLQSSLSTSVIQTLNNAGIAWSYSYTEDSYNLMITFSADFTAALEWEKENAIAITAIDDNKLQRASTLTIEKTAAPISSPIEVAATADAPLTLTTNSYVATGEIYSDDDADIYVYYKETASRSVIQVKATKNGNTFSASLTGLTPNTTYTYYYTMGDYTSNSATFTTEPETQLENAGFEEWDTSSTPYLIYASGGSMFWDSGNHGSATMSKNVTVPSTDYKHSGSYSIQLQSQFVGISIIGKFAAGNVFIGEYLATDGTDGVLGWGRPFIGRPTKLKGWVKYSPGTVDYESSSWSEIAKGDSDEGIIYWALLDETVESYNGKEYPVIIKTKSSDRQLFDSTGSNVVAYGEKRFTSATDGDGLIEFEIPLTYYRTDLRPTYIMCTCAASRGGDYFVGSSSSVMYLDDLELVYE